MPKGIRTGEQPKLSQTDILKIYDMYYNYDKSRSQPTMAYIAHLYNVSTNTIFMVLNREKQRRNTNTNTNITKDG